MWIEPKNEDAGGTEKAATKRGERLTLRCLGFTLGLERAEAERLAALAPWPDTQAMPDTASAWWLLHYPDRDPVQLVSHPPATLAQILKQHPEALAAEPFAWPHPEPGPALDADRRCWPHTSAMNAQEIDTFTARLGRFTDKGMSHAEAEALADKLVRRDREADDRRHCVECAHLQSAGRWRCGNWRQAEVARDGLARKLAQSLQRCPGFKLALVLIRSSPR